MAKVLFKRIEDSANINNIEIEDGSFIVTGDGKTYVDYGEDRIPTSGTPDTEMSDRSRNTVENNVIKEYVDTSLNNLLLTQTQSIPVGNLSGGGEKFDQTTDITIPTGYTPIGIVGFSISGGSYTRAFLCRLDISSNKDKIVWSIRNSSSDTLSNISISVTMLFVKNN